MKKAIITVALLALSGAASAHQWAANGFRVTQVGTGTTINTVEIKQDGFNNEDLCEQFIDDQKSLASKFNLPAGQNTQSVVHAKCSIVKQVN